MCEHSTSTHYTTTYPSPHDVNTHHLKHGPATLSPHKNIPNASKHCSHFKNSPITSKSASLPQSTSSPQDQPCHLKVNLIASKSALLPQNHSHHLNQPHHLRMSPVMLKSAPSPQKQSCHLKNSPITSGSAPSCSSQLHCLKISPIASGPAHHLEISSITSKSYSIHLLILDIIIFVAARYMNIVNVRPHTV
ncbi:hypothetical protein PAXRUDRAFT_766497 [Paxillus rubicundulus Ve08.2h10]|uniref:Uncharacterized protein n=1 Tax=Paxillus rubicundulus Ve08.2h10 TaxID=930991 RepID=A0A0D0DNJ3_9AGAM|nr:hypothetical protein PAXRUDRAFT_766497 [Paxillus rubicundulus Ve08.2h10]